MFSQLLVGSFNVCWSDKLKALAWKELCKLFPKYLPDISFLSLPPFLLKRKPLRWADVHWGSTEKGQEQWCPIFWPQGWDGWCGIDPWARSWLGLVSGVGLIWPCAGLIPCARIYLHAGMICSTGPQYLTHGAPHGPRNLTAREWQLRLSSLCCHWISRPSEIWLTGQTLSTLSQEDFSYLYHLSKKIVT